MRQAHSRRIAEEKPNSSNGLKQDEIRWILAMLAHMEIALADVVLDYNVMH